jgi:hypothetical protein
MMNANNVFACWVIQSFWAKHVLQLSQRWAPMTSGTELCTRHVLLRQLQRPASGTVAALTAFFLFIAIPCDHAMTSTFEIR